MEQWRDEHLVTARAQGRSGLFSIELGPGDEQTHANQAEWQCVAVPIRPIAVAAEDCTS